MFDFLAPPDFFFFLVIIIMGPGQARAVLGALLTSRCWAATTDFSAVPTGTGLDLVASHAARPLRKFATNKPRAQK